VHGPAGSVTLPVTVVDMADQVVWLPMRSPGCAVRTDLGAGPGTVVRLSAGSIA
jgi:NADH-quinone oxidoreductase subunit G